jgi:hypothetical protein
VNLPQPRCIHASYEEPTKFVSRPPYESFEHWSRCLDAAKLVFEDIEKEWRGREDGLAEDFEKRVRIGVEGLEGLLVELRVVE